MRSARSLLAVLLAMLALDVFGAPARLASRARADALPEDYEPPVCSPMTCPDGSLLGGGGHGSCPASCIPISVECAPDGSCPAPARCVPTRFCLDMRGIGRIVANVVVGECAPDGSCAEGTCHEVSRCVTDPPGTGGPSMPGPREGSGSGAGAGASSAGGAAPSPPPAAPAASGGMCAAARVRGARPVAALAALGLGAALAGARSWRRRR